MLHGCFCNLRTSPFSVECFTRGFTVHVLLQRMDYFSQTTVSERFYGVSTLVASTLNNSQCDRKRRKRKLQIQII